MLTDRSSSYDTAEYGNLQRLLGTSFPKDSTAKKVREMCCFESWLLCCSQGIYWKEKQETPYKRVCFIPWWWFFSQHPWRNPFLFCLSGRVFYRKQHCSCRWGGCIRAAIAGATSTQQRVRAYVSSVLERATVMSQKTLVHQDFKAQEPTVQCVSPGSRAEILK